MAKTHKVTIKRLVSFYERTLGLIDKSTDTPVYFSCAIGVHTWFMRYPIDLYILDHSGIVIEKVCNIQPYRIHIWGITTKEVLESRAGSLGINIGDKIVCVDG